MKCSSCGNDLKIGQKFCTKCGTPILQEGLPDNSSINAKFIWQEKYTYIAIAVIFVLAACLGVAVKVIKSSKEQPAIAGDVIEKVAATEQEESDDDINQTVSSDNEERTAVNRENKETEYEQTQEEQEGSVAYDEIGIHVYELIVDDVTWTEAYENCLRMGGHLVRINSDSEYNAILQQIQNEDKANIKFWIGGYRGIGRDYRWVYNDNYDTKDEILVGDIIINEDSMYAGYWLDGEPSFYDEMTETEENRMNMFYMKDLGKWVWNDVTDDLLEVASFYAGTVGYICEFE